MKHSIPPPALGAVRGRRITNRELARRLDCTETWVGRVLLGHVPAPRRFRQDLAELLGEPVESLFPREVAPAAPAA